MNSQVKLEQSANTNQPQTASNPNKKFLNIGTVWFPFICFINWAGNNQCPTSFAVCPTGKETKIAKTFVAMKDTGEEQTLGDLPSPLHNTTNNTAWLSELPLYPSGPSHPQHHSRSLGLCKHSTINLPSFKSLKGHLKLLLSAWCRKASSKSGGCWSSQQQGAAAGSSWALG